MQKSGLLFYLSISTIKLTFATGMAVTLNNMYLANTSGESIAITLNNLNQAPTVNLSPKTVCKLPNAIFFTPNLVESDSNFYILFTVKNNYNAIVMNQDSISLASNSKWSKAYTQDTTKFNLEAICGSRQLAKKTIATIAVNQNNNPPTLAPKMCPNNYSFVYSYGKPSKQVLSAISSAKSCVQ